MEEMKVVLREVVAQRLSAAPDSVAKAELIEELTENLYCRYADLTASGVEPDEARARAVDALGDTDELVEYLKGLEPDQPLPELVLDTEKPDGGQIEEILHNVEDILRGAFHKAKTAFKSAKEAVKDGLDTEIKIEIRKDGDLSEPEQKMADGEQAMEEEFHELEEELDDLDDELDDLEDELDDLDDAEDGVPEKGWKVTYQRGERSVEITSDELKASMKDMMKDIEKVIRNATGAAKDAYKTAKDVAGKACGDISAACTPDTIVEADQPIDAEQLKRIEVQTFCGDITVRMSQEPDGDVLVGGDIEDIEVFRSAGGVLTIRPVKTETSGFFFGRGIFNGTSAADVELELPRRQWEFLKLTTTSGDVEVSGDCPVEGVAITTVSGEIRASLPSCTHVSCRTTNGDLEWDGDVSGLQLESISGDIRYQGHAQGVTVKSTSGDVTVEGGFLTADVRTISGDVCLRSDELPGRMDVGTTSGDMWVDIPDGGPFTAKFRSTSGEFRSDFFSGSMGGRSCMFHYQGGGEGEYSFGSISGDVELRKYR